MEGLNLEASIGSKRRKSPRRWSASSPRVLRRRVSGSLTPTSRPNRDREGQAPRKNSTPRSRSITSPRGRMTTPRTPRMSRPTRASLLTPEKGVQDWENLYLQSQARLRELQRENQVLQTNNTNLKERQQSKSKTLGQERKMRLAANRGKYEILQELERLRRKHAGVFRKLSSMGIELDTEGDGIDNLTDVLFSALDSLAHECEKHAQEIKRLGVDNAKKESRLARTNMDADRLRDDLSDSRGDYNEAVSSLSERHRRQIKKWEETEARRLAEIAGLQAERDALKDENEGLSRKIDKVIKALSRMRKRLAEREAEIEDYARRLRESEAENKALRERLDGMSQSEAAARSLKKQLKDAKDEIGDLASKLYDMEREFAVLKEQHDEYKQKAEREGSALREERDDLHGALDGLKSVLKNISILGAKGIKNCKF